MTLKDKVQLPVWMITLILSALVGFFSYSITFAMSYTEIKKAGEKNTSEILELRNGEIKNLRDSKADAKEVNSMQLTLVRIENKLDNFILLKSK